MVTSSDGTTIAIGSLYNDGTTYNSGNVCIHQYHNIDQLWIQQGADLDGETANDQLIYDVSMLVDGTIAGYNAQSTDKLNMSKCTLRVS